MYLKSLELVGFKSFATKTTLEFHRGVTAVVGPNGCGKSNVLDAIRWVLGEQSAKALRGGEMADVIFSGTDSRPPLGLAEVSMTFAECEQDLGVDWNEVRITRRVFRDGKSEYLINKAPCRLRDIHELFMDTGIGRSAYSIMEQGKIDQILSSRPDDRRAIFEEAAGITKYKAQKREALRKLEHTEANLIRVADIVREVKRQIGSLQRQAGKARRYQGLSEALRIFDTHLTHRNFQAMENSLQANREEMRQLEEARELHESEIRAQEEELVTCRSRLGMLDDQIATLRDQGQQVRSRMISAESRIESHGHRMEELSGLIVRNEADISAAKDKVREQESQIEQTEARIEELLAALRTGEEALRAKEESVARIRGERETAEAFLSKLGEEISGTEARLGHLRAEQSASVGRREAAENRLASLQAESSQTSSNISSMENRLQETVDKIHSLEGQLSSTAESVVEKNQEISVLRTELTAATEASRATEKRLAELQSKLEVLRQLEAAGEGLGEGAQALLRGLEQPELLAPAITGAVASLVDIDPRFVPAIEAILGSDLQAVVFKDEGVAETALQSLASGEYGRGGLIPREWIPAQSPGGEAELPEGGIAWAADCVRGPSEVLAFLSSGLANVLLVADLEAALRLRKMHPGLGFATLNGEFISRDGSAAAGKMKAGTGAAILRKREIAGIQSEADAAKSLLQSQSESVHSLQSDLAALEEELSSIRSLQQSLEVELSAAKGERSLLERQAGEIRQRHESLSRELASLHTSLEETVARMEGLDQQLQELSATLEQRRNDRVQKASGVEELRQREAEEREQLNELRIQVATERQHRESLERQKEPMTSRLRELAELVAQRSGDIDNYRSRIASLEEEQAELQSGIVGWKEELTAVESETAGILAQRAEIQESTEALDTTLRVARKQLNDLQERRGKLEVKCTQVELRQESLKEHIARRYQLDLQNFEPDPYALTKAIKEHKPSNNGAQSTPAPTTVMDVLGDVETPEQEPSESTESGSGESVAWDHVEEIVAELTERLDAMGPVNLDAIQEFEELEERYQFLEQQNTDLTNSKNELLEVISRINKTTKEMFAETFARIRENFQEMFGELFGGGRANLLLVDESDPLESGIEIIAKPPGKQLQSVSLLSGGERTMTAVALLFSIYMVKPSPFCVLDEMDAPLDESNINRFIKILDRFIEQSQFVVITHNKRTISRADMLYGVTMEEHGISKLVGVKFHGRDEAKGSASSDEESQSISKSFGKSENLGSEKEAKPEPEPQPVG